MKQIAQFEMRIQSVPNTILQQLGIEMYSYNKMEYINYLNYLFMKL